MNNPQRLILDNHEIMYELLRPFALTTDDIDFFVAVAEETD